ncbi:hypothetical protein [Paenibacillus periandrae]|uniref:hypothetical protein n=1 Tax=Paenibacillus periandrae TaxID=1761741 RepID=UPI001F08B82B|nr:hypothetical protein [Paenibacillus periandrae]
MSTDSDPVRLGGMPCRFCSLMIVAAASARSKWAVQATGPSSGVIDFPVFIASPIIMSADAV